MSYQVPQHIDKNKIFIVNRSEIEGRLEPEFYKPSIACLETKIRSLSSKKLRHYALSFAGGATPKKSGEDKYYSDSKNGIPFLRVQNLQTTGELSLDGCIYINDDTHNGLLKRSQVSEGDLLIKITGVGRMAIASVAPKNFVGNTNQHMVVVKTGNVAISKYLAHYLNLDIIEKIASRHSTGGTRPALDYPSLKNLPVIEDIDFSTIDNAIKLKKEKDKEAQLLLDSIDDYLLKELGITIPKVKNDVNNRMFIIHKNDIIGRYTPSIYKNAVSLRSELYDNIQLSHVAYINPNTKFPQISEEMQISFVPMESVNETYAEIENYKNCTVNDSKGFTRFQEGDLLWAKITPCMENGKSSIAQNLTNAYGCGSTEFHVIRPKNNSIMVEFIHSILHMKLVRETAKLYFGGSAGQQRVASDFLEKMNVPFPPIDKQQEIVDCISTMRNKAKRLQEEGKIILENAKREIERMIIGNDNI